MQDKAQESWLSGWTIAVILVLLLVVLALMLRGDVEALKTGLERGSAESLIESLERNKLYDDGVLAAQLASVGELPKDARVASAGDLASTAQNLRAALTEAGKRTDAALAEIEQVVGRQEIFHEELTGVDISLAALHDSLDVVETAVETVHEQAAAAVTALGAQATELSELKAAQQGIEGTISTLSTAQTETARAMGTRLGGVEDDVEALVETVEAAATAREGLAQRAADAEEQARRASEQADAVEAEVAGLAGAIAAEKTAREDAVTDLSEAHTTLGQRVANAENGQRALGERQDSQGETLDAQAAQIAALLGRLEALEGKVAEALPEGMPSLAWRGPFDGSAIALGQLGAGTELQVSVTVEPSAAGSLRLVVASETPSSTELLSFEGESASNSVTVPYAAGALSLEGSGSGYVTIRVSLVAADDDF